MFDPVGLAFLAGIGLSALVVFLTVRIGPGR